MSCVQPHDETFIREQKREVPDFTAVFLAKTYPEFKRRKAIWA